MGHVLFFFGHFDGIPNEWTRKVKIFSLLQVISRWELVIIVLFWSSDLISSVFDADCTIENDVKSRKIHWILDESLQIRSTWSPFIPPISFPFMFPVSQVPIQLNLWQIVFHFQISNRCIFDRCNVVMWRQKCDNSIFNLTFRNDMLICCISFNLSYCTCGRLANLILYIFVFVPIINSDQRESRRKYSKHLPKDSSSSSSSSSNKLYRNEHASRKQSNAVCCTSPLFVFKSNFNSTIADINDTRWRELDSKKFRLSKIVHSCADILFISLLYSHIFRHNTIVCLCDCVRVCAIATETFGLFFS